ncbi:MULTISPECIES: WYL domain-containing protein [Pectobacterium]|uniref:WYL domain-containing protein n=1 Tax=Pectobacterium TaxID=122277 RepID=UPI00068F46CA|nr:WYL domain-containing protein [Pectobacterium carotovorum]SHH66760.1 hypothetical protein SAMN05444147_11575 [Pectobacterium carotovorum]
MNVVIATAFFSLSIVVLTWVIYGVWSEPQDKNLKIGKSVLAAWYFLTAGDAMRSVDDFSVGFIMLIVGFATAFYLSKRKTKSKDSNESDENKVKKEIAALRKLGSANKPLSASTFNNNQSSEEVGMYGTQCIAFSYVDSTGNQTRREVDVESVDGEYVYGYCHLAGDTRTFLLNRIEGNIIVMDTGELLDPYKWADSFDSK